MTSTLIFDFDGTLVDTVGSIWAEYQRVMGKLNLRRVSHREFTRQIGRTWEEIIKSLWPDLDPSDFTREYRVDAEEPRSFPGLAAALSELSPDYLLVIMTSRGEETLHSHLREAGIDTRLFRAIYHKGNMEHNKPDPRALTQVCGELGLKPADAVYVGDSIIDAECAFKAGLGFIAVLSGGAYVEDFREMGVEYVIGSASELPKLLDEIVK